MQLPINNPTNTASQVCRFPRDSATDFVKVLTKSFSSCTEISTFGELLFILLSSFY
jgi:hypothetical protein